jgi:hypothetical protein
VEPALTGAAPERRARRRRAGTRGLLVLAAVLVGTVASAPGAATAAGSSCAGSAGRVPLVVDFGTVSAGPGALGVVTLCVPVGSRATGSDVLAAASAQLGWPSPRYNSVGLLCAIGDYPRAPACADRDGSHFLYWSYWRGTPAGWTYQSAGPATVRPSQCGPRARCTVEGWRFVDGADTTAAGLPQPQGPSDPNAIPGPTASTPTPATPPAAVSPGPAQGPAAAGPSTPAGSGTTAPASRGGRAATPTTTPATHPAARHGAHHTAPSTTAPDEGRRAAALGPIHEAVGQAPIPTAHTGTTGHRNAAVGLGIGVAAIVALVAVGFLRTRRAHP